MTVSPMVEGFCDDSEVEQIKRGTGGKALYAWGVIDYHDVFGESQRSNFGQIYTWLVDGKVWGYYTERHNDAT